MIIKKDTIKKAKKELREINERISRMNGALDTLLRLGKKPKEKKEV